MSDLADRDAYYGYYDFESLMEAARHHAARGDEERAEVYAAAAAALLGEEPHEWPE